MSSPIWPGSTPDSAIALAPAIAAASAKDTSVGHQRRSVIPAKDSSSPGRSPTRVKVPAIWSSISADVTTMGASAIATDRTAVSR